MFGRRRAWSVRYRAAVAAALVAAVSATAFPVSAVDRTWTLDAEFTAGTLVDAISAGDQLALSLDGVGSPDASSPWWDTSWGQRRCIEITNAGASVLEEYQVEFTLDTTAAVAGGRLDADGDDIRFIAADGVTELDHWIEGPMNASDTRFWVQVDSVPVGASSICMYYDNPAAASTSDPIAPFVHSTPLARYVAVSELQAGRAITVVSYSDGNVVSDGAATVTLDSGDVHTFPASASHTAATVVTANGPLAIKGLGQTVDTFVPAAFAGTQFVVPTQRSSNRVSIYAPFADASVTVVHGATTTTFTVPVGTSVSSAANTGSNQAAVITSDVPVLATHRADSNDSLVLYPATSESLIGIRSTQHLTGFAGSTTAQVRESDGTSTSISGNSGTLVSRTGGGSQGSGPAVITTPSTAPIAAAQEADSDGGEATSHWPLSELNERYYLPIATQYTAIACPTQTTGSIEVDGVIADCTGSGGVGHPGKQLTGALAAGDLIRSLDGQTFYAYFEDASTNDENNVLGPKQARQLAQVPPAVVVGAEQSPYVSTGTWTSDAHDAGCAADFGALSWNPLTQPAGTSVEFQVATAPTAAGSFAFVGPDGTGATTFTAPAGTPLAGVHAGDQFVQVRSVLATTDVLATPVITDVTVEATGTVSVSGDVFSDLDGDGVDDPADFGLVAAPVQLWRDDGDGVFDDGTDTFIETVTTIADGSYSFSRQAPGSFFVAVDAAAVPGSFVPADSTPSPRGPITLAECGSAELQFGLVARVPVQVTVFSDVAGDGSDSGDPTLDGVLVELWRDDGDGIFSTTFDEPIAVASTTGGIANFEVPPGDYFARVSPTDAPAGHFDDPTTTNPAVITILPGLSSVTGDPPVIGFQPAAALSGVAFVDADADDVLGVDETRLSQLFIDVHVDDGDGVFDPATDARVRTVSTDSGGRFAVETLTPGYHWLVPFDPSPDAGALGPQLVTIGSGATVSDLPFPPTASIAGVVVFDDDGIVDDQSTPVPGMAVVVYLDDGDERFDPATDRQAGLTLTGADGAFSFSGLADGSYFVTTGGSVLAELGIFPVGSGVVGPVAAGTTDVVLAFDRTSVVLPATGPVGAGVVMRWAGAILLAGCLLLVASNRRRRGGDIVVRLGS